MDDNATLAVLVAQLKDMKDAQTKFEDRVIKEMQGVREEIRASHDSKVSRNEWLQRNESVDLRFRSQGEEISELKIGLAAHKSEITSKRAPWWNIATVIAAGLTVAVLLIDKLTGG